MTAKGRSPDPGQVQAASFFADLRREAPAISRATRVPLEDVEQQMMLMCLEVQQVLKYDARRGSPRSWLIKRVWKWARRWSKAAARGEDGDFGDGCEMPAERTCTGTDEVLIKEETEWAEERLLAHLRQCRGVAAEPRTSFEFFSVERWSERAAGTRCGGSRKMARHAKRYAAALESIADPARARRPAAGLLAADSLPTNI